MTSACLASRTSAVFRALCRRSIILEAFLTPKSFEPTGDDAACITPAAHDLVYIDPDLTGAKYCTMSSSIVCTEPHRVSMYPRSIRACIPTTTFSLRGRCRIPGLMSELLMSPSSRPRARTTPTNSYPSGQLRLVHPTLQFGTISSVSSFPYAYRGTPCQLAFSMAFTLIRVASFMLINIRLKPLTPTNITYVNSAILFFYRASNVKKRWHRDQPTEGMGLHCSLVMQPTQCVQACLLPVAVARQV
jgi:hypothetical protein